MCNNMLIYYMFSTILFLGFSSSCKPSVEGETYIFRHVFKHELEEPLELVWLRNKVPISTCRKNMACYDYSADGTVTTLNSLGNGLFEVNIILINVTKNNAGTMNFKYLGLASLKHSKPLFTCQLQVYAYSGLMLKDCHDVVEEGSEVKCLCNKNHDILEDFVQQWFNHMGKLLNNGSHLLSFIAKENHTAFSCRGWRSDGVESKPLEYSPMILNHKSEQTSVGVQESSFTYSIVVIVMFILSMLLLLVTVAVFCFRTKERINSKHSFNLIKDFTIDKKRKESLLFSLDFPVVLDKDDIKPYSLLNTRLFGNKIPTSTNNLQSFYSILQPTELKSEDNKGHTSKGEDKQANLII